MPEEPFSLFGFGPGGLPDEFDIWLGQEGEVELLAEQIIARWKELAAEKQDQGRRGVIDAYQSDLNAAAFILLQWHRKHNFPVPPVVCEALAHVLGLVGPKTGKPIPPKSLMKQLGLPPIDKLKEFRRAAELEGKAIAGGQQLSHSELERRTGVSRATLRGWKKLEIYRRWVRQARTWEELPAKAWERWNRPKQKRDT